MASLSVLGAGSWGTALAILLARNGHDVLLWGHNPKHVRALHEERRNSRFLPATPFPPNLQVSDNLSTAATFTDTLLVVVPSHAFRGILNTVKPHLSTHPKIVWATKGLELESGMLLHEVVRDVLGSNLSAAVLSGPSFAAEVASGQPTAITVGSESVEFASELVALLHNPQFRPYSSPDIIGVELGGAIKNVLAIAAGVADGLGYGANARAALITRGLAEMMRLGMAMGGRPDTLMGLSGVGDLILTCTDNQSRNRRFGLSLGQGKSREDIVAAIGQEIEGIPTASIIHRLAYKHGIEMPITEQVYRILYEDLPPAKAVSSLLLREPKPESNLTDNSRIN